MKYVSIAMLFLALGLTTGCGGGTTNKGEIQQMTADEEENLKAEIQAVEDAERANQ
ncbi:hypothetical protein AB1L30_17045 [Bremerella sp. JC817]|uniref:hypothetical protein n=1 Tax=Bremerella sp. JC817 TaxID=3231756 RepID=UPI003457C60D